jgi:hypothetical protein
MKFRIPCKWTVRTVEEVEARSLHEAETKALALGKPSTLVGAEVDEDELFPVDMARMRKMHPVPEPPDPMKGWKHTWDDGYNQVYERRYGKDLVTVGARLDGETIGPAFFQYSWTITRGADDFSVTSKKCFGRPEEAAVEAEKALGKMRSVIGR